MFAAQLSNSGSPGRGTEEGGGPKWKSPNWANGASGVSKATAPSESHIATADCVFLPGHRLRVQVASSYFPRWDRTADARQVAHHDAARASRIVLPVLYRA